ncbi:hypothetical protein Cch01nite_18550 [Cellulomonas chitinilytica]|uniref:Uncharacterized protein n=1 Tax=Cellulomonas chitinilytica TaxID=398759 RepID=A0A919P0J7_9CELL|nr:hypothetical protein [Cellulomonas chitinilytica]GIG21131.1 hypothetical protein Cch01nite_18550 [Cellulomonas chitinilytica]
MAAGFDVEYDVLSSAATSIRRVVENGTAQTQCFAWGDGYGHASLSQAIELFVSDVDLAVDSHAARTTTLATDLDDQLEDYQSADAATDARLQSLAGRLSPGVAGTASVLVPTRAPATAPVFPFRSGSR